MAAEISKADDSPFITDTIKTVDVGRFPAGEISADLVEHRKWIRRQLEQVVGVFLKMNGVVLFIVVLGTIFEYVAIVTKFMGAEARIFNSTVFLALIAATVAQLATLAVFVGQTLARSLNDRT